MNKPLVSICIPTYNGERYIIKCIGSALNQTYTNIEILLIDDCSVDTTCNLIESSIATDKRIRLVRNNRNLGLVANWNKCIDIAKGEWIKFLFQDDILENTCIETMVNSISNDIHIIASARNFVFENAPSEVQKTYYRDELITFEKLGIASITNVFIPPARIAGFAVENICLNFIGEPTFVMFKKSIVIKSEAFNEDLTQICDLEFFLRIAAQYGVIYIPKPLAQFTIHQKSATSLNITNKNYLLTHVDTILTVHQMLYDKQYILLRKALSFMQKLKLQLFFNVRVYESFKTANETTTENHTRFITIADKYPEIKNHKNGSLLLKLLLKIVKLKRVLQKHK